MDVCLLNSAEVGRLRNYDILPDHRDHIHIDAKQAFKGVEEEIYEIVEGKNGRNYITACKQYNLELRRSGGKYGIPVVQRVIAPQLTHIIPPKVRNY